MTLVIEGVTWILLLAGGFFLLTGSLGLLRLPDFFTRLHSAGVSDTLGATLILAGLMVQGGLTLITVKLVIVWLFLMLTGPTASHALAKAALSDGLKPLLASPAATAGPGTQKTKDAPPSP